MKDNITKVEIEKTNKRWKKVKLAALGIFVLGVVFSNMSSTNQGSIFGMFLFISICTYIGARIGVWWTNGQVLAVLN